MSNRYFFDGELKVGHSYDLSDSESHHLIHVMRSKVGATLTLFNGSGCEFPAKIAALTKKKVTVDVLEKHDVDRGLKNQLVVAMPLPKSDRQKFLIEKLTELGATEFLPIITERASVVANAKNLEKLRRLVIEASKQCGRNKLMKISNMANFAELCDLRESDQRFDSFKKLIAIPNAPALETTDQSSNRVILIGPEGGFSQNEVELASASDWKAIGFGKSILRMETAALVAAALCRV